MGSKDRVIIPGKSVHVTRNDPAYSSSSQVKNKFWQGWTQRWGSGNQKTHRQRERSRHFLVRSLLVGATVVVSVIGWGSYQVVQGIILGNLKKQALLEAHQGRGDIDQWLAIRKAEVTVLANSPITRTLNWSVVEPYFQAEVKRQQEFDQLTLARPDGSYSNTNASIVNSNLRDRPWFSRTIDGETTVSDPAVSRTSQVTKIFVSAPIFDRSSLKALGVVAEAIRATRIAQVLNQIQYGSGSYAFALNSQGFIIAHPNSTLISTLENPGVTLLKSADSAIASVAQEMVSRREGIRLIQLDGSSKYIAYVSLKEANWSVALVIPRQNIESALDALNVLAGILGLVVLIAIAGAWQYVEAYEQTRFQAAQEALLNRLTTRIRESLDLPTIAQTTVTELSSLLDLQRVFLANYNPATQTLSLVGDSRMRRDTGQPIEFQTSSSSDLAEALNNGHTLQLNAVAPLDHPPLSLTTGSYLAIANPLLDGRTGFLIGLHNGKLSLEDRDLLKAVSDQLAIAVTQAQLYSQAQEQVHLLNQTLTKLNQAQLQLVQSEKMSSLGQLVAGIAHEINNPVNFIHGNIVHATQYAQELLDLLQLYQLHLPHPATAIQNLVEEIDIDFVSQDFPKLLESMQVGTERIREIVQSLRIFSRLDEAEVKDVDIHEGIDSTLMILQSRLKARATQRGIQVMKEYGQLPVVECYAGQLNQVFMNILSNAIDALETARSNVIEAQNNSQDSEPVPVTIFPTPVIHIRTDVGDTRSIHIRIADNGSGISAEVQSRIFDPFFTTKPVGKGTGMGLAISYQIITEQHRGHLHCNSTLGQGTEFVIEIPLRQSSDFD